MMITKERLLKSIAEMPDRINIDELLDQVLLIQKIEVGLQQSAEGKVTDNESFKKEMKQWFDSTGQNEQKKM
jgi:hypothetical protein